MALKSTVVKAELQISDMDRHYYATHNLTLAQHPSETDARLMVRLLAVELYKQRGCVENMHLVRNFFFKDSIDELARRMRQVGAKVVRRKKTKRSSSDA